MAFIREYAAMSAGDPFSLRRPKWLRKLQPGKLLKKVGKMALPFASFIPGVGTLAGGLIGRLTKLKKKIPLLADAIDTLAPEEQEKVLDFARGYGIDVGDAYYDFESGDPRGERRKGGKRKSAASGPKAKAAKKADKRAGRRGSGMPPKSKKPSAGGGGGVSASDIMDIIRQNAGGAIGAASDFAKAAAARDVGGMAGAAFRGPGMRRMGGAGGRRSINPTNVKALRRSMRRIEGFEKLVKRVHKAYPRLRAASASGGARASGGRGHRSGCACFACRKRAA